MIKYHKINSLFKRDKRGKFTDEFTNEEFEYLFHNSWVGTEKIDGTNISIQRINGQIKICGRTENSQIPTFLYQKMESYIKNIKFNKVFPDNSDFIIYGEGYGNKIQKVGKEYNPDNVDFIVFDIRINNFWLKRKDVEDICYYLNLDVVPVVFEGNLMEAIKHVKSGFKSKLGELQAEGIVLVPEISLKDRLGNRIITKLKTKDLINY